MKNEQKPQVKKVSPEQALKNVMELARDGKKPTKLDLAIDETILKVLKGAF